MVQKVTLTQVISVEDTLQSLYEGNPEGSFFIDDANIEFTFVESTVTKKNRTATELIENDEAGINTIYILIYYLPFGLKFPDREEYDWKFFSFDEFRTFLKGVLFVMNNSGIGKAYRHFHEHGKGNSYETKG